MAEVFRLDAVPRRYAWGSASTLQNLLGVEPDGTPLAELWFGAHPGGASPVHGATLDALVASDPEGLLGADVAARFGGRLPFLVKLLAADRPLSLQVHPDRAQAEAGFAREQAAGIPIDAPERCYRDTSHKPELLCALSEFDALCGFRPVQQTLALLDHLDLPGLAQVRELLAGPDGLRRSFTHLLTLAEPAPLVEQLVARADGSAPVRFAGALRAARVAAAQYPGDPGVLVTLLLNDVRLAPGEAIFLRPGSVHAYLRGSGVEVMATSDNVVRAGLTPKHVDVAELLAITDFTELPEPRWPDEGNAFCAEYRPPVADFALYGIDLDAYRKPGRPAGSCAVGLTGPLVALCVSGTATVRSGRDTATLRPAQAAFVPARDTAITVQGTGRTFFATVGSAG